MVYGRLEAMALTVAELMTYKGSFLVSPEDFLRRHVVYTPGAMAPAASGIVPIYLSESTLHAEKTRPGSRLGVLSRPFHKTDAISISNQNPVAGGLGFAAVARACIQFNVHWIETSFHPAGAVTPFPWYTLTAASGVMVTQRLTGCSFVVDPAAGATRVAHIMPSPPETGAQLRARLVALLGAGVSIYGRGEYNQEREATVVGVDNGHGWHIYAQKQDLMSFKVRSVKQIFP
jgi:hypothetical protein